MSFCFVLPNECHCLSFSLHYRLSASVCLIECQCLSVCLVLPTECQCLSVCFALPTECQCLSVCFALPTDCQCLSFCLVLPTECQCLSFCLVLPTEFQCLSFCLVLPTEFQCLSVCIHCAESIVPARATHPAGGVQAMRLCHLCLTHPAHRHRLRHQRRLLRQHPHRVLCHPNHAKTCPGNI